MSGLFAERDPDIVLAEALAVYKTETGVDLAPADPRRLHLQSLLLLLSQIRALVDFAGKQNLLRYISDLFIDAYAELWGEEKIPAAPSTCTVRYAAPDPFDPIAVPTGVRVGFGSNTWAVKGGPYAGTGTVDVPVECTEPGASSNGVAAGQIVTMVDEVPGIASVENISETIGGKEIEGLEAFRIRLRSVPESRSTCGPRLAYEAAALEASAAVADAVAIGPNDDDLFGSVPNPGEVHILIIEGTRNDDGTLATVVPDPSAPLIAIVEAALSEEDIRPLTDLVIVREPSFTDYDLDVTYYISRDRADAVSTIQPAVEAAFEAYKLWQSKIGRDLNLSKLTWYLVNAGAKRVSIAEPPAPVVLLRDEATRLGYENLTYGGVEDE